MRAVMRGLTVHDRLRDIRLKSVLRTKLRFSVKIRTNTGGWQHCVCIHSGESGPKKVSEFGKKWPGRSTGNKVITTLDILQKYDNANFYGTHSQP